MGDTVHVFPVEDGIEHIRNAEGSCICGPNVVPAFLDDGSNGWVVVHHSLDGRELKEG